MNFKLIFKALFVVAMLSLLVIMGLHNKSIVELSMPELNLKPQKLPSALMYFGFFGLGFLSGAILMAGGGGGKKSSSSKKD